MTEVGPELIDVSDYVCFTGSTTTGPKVAAQCADRLIGCSLELGGKNPLLVLDDAESAQAADGAVRACFANAGQLCVSTERIYVAEPLPTPFRRRWRPGPKALRLGNSYGYDHDMGSPDQQTQLERVSAHVEDARGQGGDRASPAVERRPDLGPLFYEPTILTGVTPEMDLLRRGDVRTGGQRLPGGRRRRGGHPGQRVPVRAERERLDLRHRPRPTGGRARSGAARST